MDTLTRSLMAAAASGAVDNENPLGLTIGQSYQGGYFAGYISHTADGVPTHALIVSPRATGQTTALWKTSDTSTSGTQSTYDGAANTASMANATHPAANFCANLSTGGYSDWYMPARDELDIAYFNLKPDTTANSTSTGINNYSVPKRTANYTSSVPGQTTVSIFQSGGSEAFSLNLSGTPYGHWSSTEGVSGLYGLYLYFADGSVANLFKSSTSYYVRAFRKVAV